MGGDCKQPDPQTVSLRECAFSFGAHPQQLELRVLCRHGPEAKAQLSLTLQNEEQQSSEAPRCSDDIGLDVWPASPALAEYLASHPGILAGRSALELGSGVGLGGLAAAALGAASVVLTDYDSAALDALRRNAALNGLAAAASVARLDWERPGACALSGRAFDLVLACDVLYASKLAPRLLAAVQHFLAPAGVLLLAHQLRRAILLDPATRRPRLEDADVPFVAFCELAGRAGFSLKYLREQGPGSSACSGGLQDPGGLQVLAFSRCDKALAALPAEVRTCSGGAA